MHHDESYCRCSCLAVCNQSLLLSETLKHRDYIRIITRVVTTNNYVDDDTNDDDDDDDDDNDDADDNDNDDINDTSCNILSPASMYCI